MRIGIDVTTTAWGKPFGVGKYIIRILEYLLCHEVKCVLFYRLTKPKHIIFLKQKNVKHVFSNKNYLGLNRPYWEQFILPYLIKKYNLNVYHAPDNYGIPIFSDCPSIITVHDIIPALLLPESYPSFTVSNFKVFPGLSLMKATQAIAVSNFTKKDLEKFYNIPKSKINVIYNGIDSIYKPTKNNKVLNRYKKKFGFKDNFIVYLSGANPRKNHERLIKAFRKFKSKYKNDFKLLLVGEGNEENIIHLKNLTKEMYLSNNIIFAGYLPIKDIPVILSSAKLMIYPSLYEGFGLPPLEAMACGCPVACSNTSSLPEVTKDAALMFNPYNIEEISEAIHKVTTNRQFCDRLIAKGFNRIKNFSWKKTQEETFKIYLSLVNKKKL